jgi:Flp pilus assembly protein TadG
MRDLSLIKKSAGGFLSGLLGRRLIRFLDDRCGATAIALTLSLAGISGFSALGTEAANWYYTKRAMQGAADAAASTAAAALAAGAPSSTFATEAKSIAAGYKFVDGSNGTTVTVNYPPKSGD